MVFSLSEMAVVHPSAGSFGTYCRNLSEPWAGTVVRYTYWNARSSVGGRVRSSRRLHDLLVPGTPVWLWSAAFAFTLLYSTRVCQPFRNDRIWFRVDQK